MEDVWWSYASNSTRFFTNPNWCFIIYCLSLFVFSSRDIGTPSRSTWTLEPRDIEHRVSVYLSRSTPRLISTFSQRCRVDFRPHGCESNASFTAAKSTPLTRRGAAAKSTPLTTSVAASLSWPDRGHHIPALTVTSGGRGVGFDVACSGTPGGSRTLYACNSTRIFSSTPIFLWSDSGAGQTSREIPGSLRERFRFKQRSTYPGSDSRAGLLCVMGVIPFTRAPSPRPRTTRAPTQKPSWQKLHTALLLVCWLVSFLFCRGSFLVGVLPLGPRLCLSALGFRGAFFPR